MNTQPDNTQLDAQLEKMHEEARRAVGFVDPSPDPVETFAPSY